MQFTFKCKDVDEDDYGTELEVKTNKECWPDVLQDFIYFLRGSGFIIPRETILLDESKIWCIPHTWTEGIYAPEVEEDSGAYKGGYDTVIEDLKTLAKLGGVDGSVGSSRGNAIALSALKKVLSEDEYLDFIAPSLKEFETTKGTNEV
jgi:hypothetical protein